MKPTTKLDSVHEYETFEQNESLNLNSSKFEK